MSIPTPNRLELEEDQTQLSNRGRGLSGPTVTQTQMKEVDTSTSTSSFGEKDEEISAVDSNSNADPARIGGATKLGLERDYMHVPTLTRGKDADADAEEYDDDEEGLVHTGEGTRIRSGEDVAK
jgi:hypothetical protein